MTNNKPKKKTYNNLRFDNQTKNTNISADKQKYFFTIMNKMKNVTINIKRYKIKAISNKMTNPKKLFLMSTFQNLIKICIVI